MCSPHEYRLARMFGEVKGDFVRIRIYRMGRIYGMGLQIHVDLVVLQRNRMAKFRVDEDGVLLQFRGSVEVGEHRAFLTSHS